MFLKLRTQIISPHLLSLPVLACNRSSFSYQFTTHKDKKDYYQILDVPRTANQEEIKKAYYNLAKKYHPDINKTEIEKFKEINQAYTVLSDVAEKSKFDAGDTCSSSQGRASSASRSRPYHYGNNYNQTYRQYYQSYQNNFTQSSENNRFYQQFGEQMKFKYGDFQENEADEFQVCGL